MLTIKDIVTAKLPNHIIKRIISLYGLSIVNKVMHLTSIDQLPKEEYDRLKNSVPLDLVEELLVYFPQSQFLLDIKNKNK